MSAPDTDNGAHNGATDPSMLLRQIPSVDRVLETAAVEELVGRFSRPLVLRALRHELDELRSRGRSGALDADDLQLWAITANLSRRVARDAVPYYRRVINATGVILHTGLGRSPLPAAAVARLAEVAGHPLRVEIDLESGDRGGRDRGVSELLCQLTGAEAASVVNNNAGATLLLLAALARGKGVILSRGELVEIGGSFRVPDVMAESGARLVEVGTTNRTHLADYERAIDEDTGMILKVHTSNYRIQGFTKEVAIEELVALGRRHGLPVVHDLGSGCLIDLEARGLLGEPLVNKSLDAGADLVCFSGDKLLGGPQAGIIMGQHHAVERCRKHPLYRALRPCRLTYLALESVLRIYQRGESEAIERIPALSRLLAPLDRLETRARTLCDRIDRSLPLTAEVLPQHSTAGSGSLPAREIPTWVVSVRPDRDGADAGGTTAQELARRLRIGDPAILTRVRDDALILDLRTIADDEVDTILGRIESAMRTPPNPSERERQR